MRLMSVVKKVSVIIKTATHNDCCRIVCTQRVLT